MIKYSDQQYQRVDNEKRFDVFILWEIVKGMRVLF